jgi:hypothetical protein
LSGRSLIQIGCGEWICEWILLLCFHAILPWIDIDYERIIWYKSKLKSHTWDGDICGYTPIE